MTTLSSQQNTQNLNKCLKPKSIPRVSFSPAIFIIPWVSLRITKELLSFCIRSCSGRKIFLLLISSVILSFLLVKRLARELFACFLWISKGLYRVIMAYCLAMYCLVIVLHWAAASLCPIVPHIHRLLSIIHSARSKSFFCKLFKVLFQHGNQKTGGGKQRFIWKRVYNLTDVKKKILSNIIHKLIKNPTLQILTTSIKKKKLNFQLSICHS